MLDVVAQNEALIGRLTEKAAEVLRSGRYILGPEVTALEQEVAEYIGVEHAIGVSSGTDALLVALMALGIGQGDEVITTPFTFFSTGGSVARVGATPVFVDIRPDTFNIDVDQVAAAITERTRAILPVHLYGQACDMEGLVEVARKHDLPIIEDAAQAIGTQSPLGPVGSLGAYGCFSFFPSKNLGGFGDAGLVTTQDAGLAEKARVIRAHGSKPKYYHALVGGNFRIDALQAALLRVKLPELRGWTAGRRRNAARYDAAFGAAGLDEDLLRTPHRRFDGHIYNQYVIRSSRRDELLAHLQEQKIATTIYYPVPLHRQECFAALGYRAGSLPVSEQASREVLALPIFAGLGEARQGRIIDTVIAFLRR
ncbi:MAG: DegT/DnrJ/EryC1/StrS family aminotransferase [Myxococcales bacterium]|nr:DegT/DnrJ/EryC1/StrS family aminotransferase [Deltaproteobacteria bacterium]MBT8480893.1 DegT/DnrJ/EryC1/StrS family aminotransferase [Deltaproteobacteria bacterium]NND29952.1 DegT/DnrJ/EryC1/StrS family aminotransferase [Myxococcales bacterium]NNK42228.1 DegT/DnrJ/EryC1/StrS family aminotransferase [Myxococcales bacterium]NNL23760.1 DegT/DnrJ/EryC1/StrS family aminotransferase [Myxococcales bacterium]